MRTAAAFFLVAAWGCGFQPGGSIRQAASHGWWDKPVGEQRVNEILDQVTQAGQFSMVTVKSDGQSFLIDDDKAAAARRLRGTPLEGPTDGWIEFDLMTYASRPTREKALQDLLARMDEGMKAKSWRQPR